MAGSLQDFWNWTFHLQCNAKSSDGLADDLRLIPAIFNCLRHIIDTQAVSEAFVSGSLDLARIRTFNGLLQEKEMSEENVLRHDAVTVGAKRDISAGQ